MKLQLLPIRFGIPPVIAAGHGAQTGGGFSWLSLFLPFRFTTILREVGDIDMIALVALLNVSQPLPWLDRHWINHQARREMLIAASMSSFDPPRPHAAPVRLAMPARAHLAPRAHALLGGPSGM